MQGMQAIKKKTELGIGTMRGLLTGVSAFFLLLTLFMWVRSEFWEADLVRVLLSGNRVENISSANICSHRGTLSFFTCATFIPEDHICSSFLRSISMKQTSEGNAGITLMALLDSL
jgi:hypothetical protein